MPSKQASSRRLFGEYLSAGPRADTAGAASQTRGRRSFQALMTYFSRMIHGQRGRIALALAALSLSTLLKLLLPAITKLSVDLVFTDNGSALADWLPLPGKRRKRWAMRYLDETIRRIIRARRLSGEDKGDLLSMLLLAADMFEDMELLYPLYRLAEEAEVTISNLTVRLQRLGLIFIPEDSKTIYRSKDEFTGQGSLF